MRLVRALVRQKSTAAAAAGKPIAHIYPNSETPVKALDPCEAASRPTIAAPHALATLQRSYATPRKEEDRRLTRANRALTGKATGGRGTAARRRAVDAGPPQRCASMREAPKTHTSMTSTARPDNPSRNAGSTPSSAATWARPRKIN